MNKQQLLEQLDIAIQEAEIYEDGMLTDRLKLLKQQIDDNWCIKKELLA